MWINNRFLPVKIQNPIRQFKRIESITCLIFASLVSDEATVRQLVEAGADVAVTDSLGYGDVVYFPLHYALASDVDSDAKVAYLIQQDASSQTATGGSEQAVLRPETYSYTGISLLLCAGLNQAGFVKALIYDHGVSVNATDWRCRTALHVAAEAGSADAVKVLVQHPDCRVNATDRRGRTALHLAAAAGHAEAVKVLVRHPSCDFSIADKDGLAAAERARNWGHDDIAALIDAKSKGISFKRLCTYLHKISWSSRTVDVCDVIFLFVMCILRSTCLSVAFSSVACQKYTCTSKL